MLSKTETVWRHLLAEAEEGRRRHPSLTEIAGELGIAVSTVHKALAEPGRNGAVVVKPGGGLRLIDPFRLAVLWAARRRLDRDINATWRTNMPAPEAERLAADFASSAGQAVVLGGFGAVVARQGGNTIADYETVIVYGSDAVALRGQVRESANGPNRVIVIEPDPLLSCYGRVTTLHQAWADLFCLDDWQAARFTDALAKGWLESAA